MRRGRSADQAPSAMPTAAPKTMSRRAKPAGRGFMRRDYLPTALTAKRVRGDGARSWSGWSSQIQQLPQHKGQLNRQAVVSEMGAGYGVGLRAAGSSPFAGPSGRLRISSELTVGLRAREALLRLLA